MTSLLPLVPLGDSVADIFKAGSDVGQPPDKASSSRCRYRCCCCGILTL